MLALAVLAGFAASAMTQEPKKTPKKADPKTPAKAAELAVAYLKTTQAADGSWGGTAAPGMTGVDRGRPGRRQGPSP